MTYIDLIYGIVAVICAALLGYCSTPPVRVLAYRIGAIDVPADARRMHKKPIPRLGGLAIFIAFCVTALIFCKPSPGLTAIIIGGLLICILGTLDDVFRLHWTIKFVVQVLAAGIAVLNGVRIEQINLGDSYVHFGVWSIPLTIIWIVGLSNAINLIDGLDGLACGVSVICSCSLVGVMLLMGDFQSALVTAVLVGACLGFLPFNRNPARIFMGDTGALFLGYALAIISVEGVFKLHTIISFALPFSIFALPLFDTIFAFFRRVLQGRSPFSADRGHLHHRLVDLGFTQKEAVGILYAITGIMGLVAVTFTDALFRSEYIRSIMIAVAAVLIFVVNSLIMKKPSTRYLSGLFDPSEIPPEQQVYPPQDHPERPEQPEETPADEVEPSVPAGDAPAESGPDETIREEDMAPVEEEPEAPSSEGPEASVAEEPEAPVVEVPEAPVAEEPEAPVAEGLEAPAAEKSAEPVTDEPEVPAAAEATPAGDEPEVPVPEEPIPVPEVRVDKEPAPMGAAESVSAAHGPKKKRTKRFYRRV